MSTVKLGRSFEELLVKYLRAKTYLVLARNTNFFSLAEIDVLVSKNRVIYFIEVKKRNCTFFVHYKIDKIVSYKQVQRQRMVIKNFSLGRVLQTYDFRHIICIGSSLNDLRFFELDFDFFKEIYL